MDKQLTFVIIGFFVICACFISWAAIGGPKRNIYCKWMALGYVALVWICIIALLVITLIYK